MKFTKKNTIGKTYNEIIEMIEEIGYYYERKENDAYDPETKIELPYYLDIDDYRNTIIDFDENDIAIMIE